MPAVELATGDKLALAVVLQARGSDWICAGAAR